MYACVEFSFQQNTTQGHFTDCLKLETMEGKNLHSLGYSMAHDQSPVLQEKSCPNNAENSTLLESLNKKKTLQRLQNVAIKNNTFR